MWALTYALQEERAECVDYILQDGFPTTRMRFTYTEVVRGGHIECMQTLVRHRVPWDGSELKMAIVKKRADCLRFLLQNGCPALLDIVYPAVGRSDVTCLKILREFGMQWHDAILLAAHVIENYNVMQYVVENGCPNPQNRPVRRSPRHTGRRC